MENNKDIHATDYWSYLASSRSISGHSTTEEHAATRKWRSLFQLLWAAAQKDIWVSWAPILFFFLTLGANSFTRKDFPFSVAAKFLNQSAAAWFAIPRGSRSRNLLDRHCHPLSLYLGPVRLAESWLKLAEKYCSDWIVVREKHCFGWKNKPNKPNMG